MTRTTRWREAAVIVLICGLWSGCGGPTNVNVNGPSGAFFQLEVRPSQLKLETDETDLLEVNVGVATSLKFSFVSSDPKVVQVSSSDNTGDIGAKAFVKGLTAGTATITVTFDGDRVTPAMSAIVPVTVVVAKTRFNGTWVGDVSLTGGSCQGTNPSYKETIEIKVAKDGTGSLTATDTPGFVRAYAIVIPDRLTFTARGTFTYFGTAVPGEIDVTITNVTANFNDQHVTYQERTAYNGCSNTFVGTLTKQ